MEVELVERVSGGNTGEVSGCRGGAESQGEVSGCRGGTGHVGSGFLVHSVLCWIGTPALGP